MKKGDIVEIYHDPITKRELEGTAKLIKRIPDLDSDPSFEWWKVTFLDDFDSGTYERKIYLN